MKKFIVSLWAATLFIPELVGCSGGDTDAVVQPGSGGGGGTASPADGAADKGGVGSGGGDGAAGGASGGTGGTAGTGGDSPSNHDAGKPEAADAPMAAGDGAAPDAGKPMDADADGESTHPPGTHPDIVSISPLANTNTKPGGEGWMDSFSHDRKCWCDSTLDHDIGKTVVDTPFGKRTIAQVCGAQMASGKKPPRLATDPIYNDVQCGNGPPNSFGDENPDVCPGRVDIGGAGCAQIGPKWDFSLLTGYL